MRTPSLQQAIERAGGVAKLASIIGVSGPAISQWKRAPVERVLAIEAATGVPRHDLRPDIYPAPSGQEAA